MAESFFLSHSGLETEGHWSVVIKAFFNSVLGRGSNPGSNMCKACALCGPVHFEFSELYKKELKPFISQPKTCMRQ